MLLGLQNVTFEFGARAIVEDATWHIPVSYTHLESDDVRIDLYDNGEVDGDSVSLFLNGKLIMARQRLSTQALTLHLTRADLQDENDLTMYAENLGSIPPNTALMVVTDGKKRYEVRSTSDLQKSGTIRFLSK